MALGFNLFNALFFEIGIFPWFMMVATLLFFPPDLPRRWVAGVAVWLGRHPPVGAPPAPASAPSAAGQRWILTGLVLYLLVQIALPLRHHLYPGFVFWTGEGYYFAWHMRAFEMRSSLELYTADPGSVARRRVRYRKLLTTQQAQTMRGRPEMVQQFSHIWADIVEERTGRRPPVFALLDASLNYRRPQLRINPEVNLADESRSLAPKGWILPLTEPLP